MLHSPAPPLSARQREVLLAVVSENIATKAPVASKHLERRYGFGVSSATIRNEMAYLEEAGYLYQPHTSAGRVPTPEAYRLYVKHIRSRALPQHEKASRIYDQECRRLKGRPRMLMRTTSQSVAALTGYPSVVMSPSDIVERFADIGVSPVSSNNMLLSYKTDTGKEVQKLLRSPDPLTAAQIARLSRALRKLYRGRAIGELGTVTPTDLAAAVADCNLSDTLLEALRQVVEAEEDREIYVDGTSYILEEPEFQQPDCLRELIQTLDRHALLREALLPAAEQWELTVAIGNQNRVKGMHRCTLIAHSYAAPGLRAGTVAVLGPMCMDYTNAMSVVSFVAERLGEAVSAE